MSAPRTENERVISLGRSAGRRGFTQTDADGLSPPIRRLAAVVRRLRVAGYEIEARGRVHNTARYVLASEPAPRPAVVGGALFADAVGAAPPRSPFDPLGDA